MPAFLCTTNVLSLRLDADMEHISGDVYTAINHGYRAGDIVDVSGNRRPRLMRVLWANGNQMILVPYRWYHRLWNWIRSCLTF